MKSLFIIVATLMVASSWAQTDAFNLEKYWKFRNEFVEKFVKIGPLKGESLPAGKRRPCNCTDTYDWGEDGTGYSMTEYGSIDWGDGMIRHGHYLGFLATEYALLKKYNEDVAGTLNEIYYALAAINRLDLGAEAALDQVYGLEGFYGPSLNGFYNRDDVPEDFGLNFTDEHWKMECTGSDTYFNNNSGKLNEPNNGHATQGIVYRNVPSLDQMSSLLVGLRMVHKLVDDMSVVQPPSASTGFVIRAEVEAIMDRMISYASTRNWEILDVNGWPVANGGGDLAWTAYPIVQCAQETYGGSYANTFKRKLITYPFRGKMQHCITGFGVDSNEPIDQDSACLSLLASSLIPIMGLALLADIEILEVGAFYGFTNNQINSVYRSWSSGPIGTVFDVDGSQLVNLWSFLIPNNYGALVADWEDDNKMNQTFPSGSLLGSIKFEETQAFSHYNSLIYFNLGVASGLWTQTQAHNFGDIGENRQLELVNAILKDELPIEDKDFYKAYLDGMPAIGAYSLEGRGYTPSGSASDELFAANGWKTDYRWANPHIVVNGETPSGGTRGIYNGMDYMYFHNLYYLFFGDELPKFEEKYSCYCDNPIQKPMPTGGTVADDYATIDLNKKLDYVGSCVQNVFESVNNDVYASFVIEPVFSEYIDMDIRPNRHQLENATIHSGANVQVQTDFVICNGKTLTTESNSDVVLNNGHLIIKTGSALDVSGTVRIKAGNRIDFDPAARMILRPGSKLIIEDEGKFLLNFSGVLEFYDGAQVIMEGPNSEFVMRSSVKMMNGGTFKLDHSASVESGRLIIGANVAFIKDMNNTNPSYVELYGKNKLDEFIILEKDKSIQQLDYTAYVDKLTIHNCSVRFEENTEIKSYQPFISYQTTFTSDENNMGIIIGDKNNFSNCDFIDVPVRAELMIENIDKFHASNCEFTSRPEINEQNQPLVYVNGMGLDIYSCEFKGTQLACLQSENLLHKSTVAGSSFQQYGGWTPSTTLVGFHDVSYVDVRFLGNSVGQMNVGVSKVGGKLSMKCNTFSFNQVNNVIAAFGCRLNLSTDDGAGYNYFHASGDANILLQSATINLRNGRNWFAHNHTYFVKGNVLSQCMPNSDCSIDASKNQWHPNPVLPAPPPQSKFAVVGSNGLPFQFSANLMQPIPPCGYYDNGDPQNEGEQSGYPLAGTSNYVTNLPNVNLSFNSNIRLDEAVEYGNKLANAGEDILALDVYDEIFDLNLPKDNQTNTWMYHALSGMKSSLENAMFDEDLHKTDNYIVFETHVQDYVEALNYMSDATIEGVNYKEQFYLEVEKSHLYRMLEIDQMSNEVLAHIDVCGLDEDEQAMLNYWKRQYAIDLLINQIGYAYIDTNVIVDTSAYNTPINYTPPIFNFGSEINGVYNISYRNCASGSEKMNAIADRPKNELNVHPNPADRFVELHFDYDKLNGEGEISITSMDGKNVLTIIHDFESKGNYISLDVSDWEQGVYTITALTKSHGFLHKQFVVTR